ncbi:hypothetical protein F5Y16DRAFT_418533 [Xylariaceae sp. FL0255]|nr:hypothetical protein F5Y16DRAFT_418533 [Xylariaceae sp. FL0255]
MTVVIVVSGLGDLGSIITEALYERNKHEMYIMTRKALTSPLTGKQYNPIIQSDYTENSLLQQLTGTKASVRSPCTHRFIPSEFSIEYDVVDNNILPFEKRAHLAARNELENRTRTLKYTYIYPGMCMDHFGTPRGPSHVRPLLLFTDPANGVAILPGDGEAKMGMCFSTDTARYVALALDMAPGTWARVMTTVTSTVNLNELVGLIEKGLGRKLAVRYQPVERYLKTQKQNWNNRVQIVSHDIDEASTLADLPGNVDIAKNHPERFPDGISQLRAFVAELEGAVALGAYDHSALVKNGGRGTGCLDLVRMFEGREDVPTPKRIEEFMIEVWREA